MCCYVPTSTVSTLSSPRKVQYRLPGRPLQSPGQWHNSSIPTPLHTATPTQHPHPGQKRDIQWTRYPHPGQKPAIQWTKDEVCRVRCCFERVQLLQPNPSDKEATFQKTGRVRVSRVGGSAFPSTKTRYKNKRQKNKQKQGKLIIFLPFSTTTFFPERLCHHYQSRHFAR